MADFKHLYEDALREGFRALSKQLGNVVSDYLSRKYEITLLETYKSPRLLSDALERSLGYGGVLIESRIIKSLYSQMNATLEGQPKIRMGHPEDFEQYINSLGKKVAP